MGGSRAMAVQDLCSLAFHSMREREESELWFLLSAIGAEEESSGNTLQIPFSFLF